MPPVPLIRNRPVFMGFLLVVLGASVLPFLAHAPNRLISGQPIWFISLPLQGVGLACVPGIALAITPFMRQSRWLLDGTAFAAFVLMAILLFMAGQQASHIGALAGGSARTSFGSGFWVMFAASALVMAESLFRAGHMASTRMLAGFASVLLVMVMIGTGHLDALSIMKEYANTSDVFWQAFIQHIIIVLGALLPTLLLGVPLGVLSFRQSGFGRGLLAGLNVVQTIPSIALFGLLMAPLSALAVAMPSLRAAGISGIGLAPAIMALTLYCLLPIVRNTSDGLAQVPEHVIQAAQGMGMSKRQIFWQVQVPLALPVFLSGLRITLVQSIGLAAVAALIGAGGLGSIMFKGLFANALDLVLLGAVPIVIMVVVVDTLFKFGVNRMSGTGQ